MKETDLYLPIKQLLEAQGYEVKGEVRGCDVVAMRGEEAPVVIELKLSLNLNLILQAVDRISLTSKVYIAVPKNTPFLKKRKKATLKLLKMLGLGLIVVVTHYNKMKAEVTLDPGQYRPRQSRFRQERLLGEFTRRVGDPNLGGVSTDRGIMTAYKQRAIAIALLLQRQGATKASLVSATLDDPKARQTLYRDVYGWFDRVAIGIYELSPRGKEEIKKWQG
ncbi:MAG: DUF2161 family putative PD-(D/E)XK-type phosphodiesterase [Gammaproteobacteria bacterium]|nr:DUF2161 family putative PD-(D/E)XK-type phosphodiesterase [Gammaproteobacteria bacterium]